MAISNCDICDKLHPGSAGTSACGIEGFFCHICRGDELDPYGEIDDAIEAVEGKLLILIAKAETGAQWAEIALIEARDLAPLLTLKSEAATADLMKQFDATISMIKQLVEAA
jgi:hypothetical protein